jgi:hypothetical protein
VRVPVGRARRLKETYDDLMRSRCCAFRRCSLGESHDARASIQLRVVYAVYESETSG